MGRRRIVGREADPIDNRVAMTGELTVHGKVSPVGGIVAKVEAAASAGATRVIIPAENWNDRFTERTDIQGDRS